MNGEGRRPGVEAAQIEPQRRRPRGFSALPLRARLVIALALTSVVPVLAVIYVHVTIILGLPPSERGYLPLLMLSTTALMLAGAVVIWDLSRETERVNRRWRELSLTDELTGAYNRRYCDQRLKEEIARADRYRHPLCLVTLDVDHFKSVNDVHGHAVGDEVLRAVFELIKSQSRAETAVCRQGGDEFAVLLPETPWTGALVYSDRIRNTIARATFPHGAPVTISVGVAAFPDDASTAEGLFKAADISLYSAKAGGRNRVGGA